MLSASDLLFFLIFWELMTLTSWVLVWFDRDNETKVRAAWLYFTVIHIATAMKADVFTKRDITSYLEKEMEKRIQEIRRK